MMKDCTLKKQPFLGYHPKDKNAYRKFIRLILKYADSVCFTVRPSLDNLDEFGRSIWSAMRGSVLGCGFAQAAADPSGEKSHLILLKRDHCLCDFLQSKNGIFDFGQEDAELGITLTDPAFIKEGEVFCYTITHEKMCLVTEDVYAWIGRK